MNSALSVQPLAIPDVRLVTPKVVEDGRGWFMEVWHAGAYAGHGIPERFVQVNQSRSRRGTLRGLHYQVTRPQGKLVRAVAGRLFDVAVDLRRASPTFGRWVGAFLSAAERNQLWIPAGFAHGFLVVDGDAEMEYFCTDLYAPEHERAIAWDDARIGIDWPLEPGVAPLLSERDRAAGGLDAAETFP
jgi:dTDP-4-dehydrorhamnose 3,5-epimerase